MDGLSLQLSALQDVGGSNHICQGYGPLEAWSPPAAGPHLSRLGSGISVGGVELTHPLGGVLGRLRLPLVDVVPYACLIDLRDVGGRGRGVIGWNCGGSSGPGL